MDGWTTWKHNASGDFISGGIKINGVVPWEKRENLLINCTQNSMDHVNIVAYIYTCIREAVRGGVLQNEKIVSVNLWDKWPHGLQGGSIWGQGGCCGRALPFSCGVAKRGQPWAVLRDDKNCCGCMHALSLFCLPHRKDHRGIGQYAAFSSWPLPLPSWVAHHSMS